MDIIVVDDFLDVPELQSRDPEFKAVSDDDRDKIYPDMEVLVRRGENVRVRVDDISGDLIVGTVLTTSTWPQPFEQYDMIQFEKKNVIDIYDINRWGVLY